MCLLTIHVTQTQVLKMTIWLLLKKLRWGGEINYDYSTTWFDGFNCNCGSKSCRGHIGDFSAIPKAVQKKYKKLGIIPDFIMKGFRLKRA